MLTELGHGAHRAEDIALAVSELVTNAVLYGPAGAVELRLLGNQELIRVEVGDQGTAPFHWPVKSDGRLHGLDLVKVFSERCGILHRPSTLAWCEFDLA
jgi:two-component sensor histidine kinase